MGGLAGEQLARSTALVTGAASGVGRATVLTMLERGAAVTAVDIDGAGLEKLAGEAASNRLLTEAGDVTAPETLRRAISRTARHFGDINVLSTCAAIAVSEPLMEVTAEGWSRIMAVNAYATVHAYQLVIPAMRRAGHGSIVTWGSIAASRAEEGLAAYCASKAAVVMLTKSIAIEHAKDNVRANCVCPGMIDTPMAHPYIPVDSSAAEEYLEDLASWQPLGLGKPEQLANVAAFLASDESSFITGSTIMVDGGYSAL